MQQLCFLFSSGKAPITADAEVSLFKIMDCKMKLFL
jgi:hypothetical protein